ncbi:CARDB domain-containing protein [Natrialbaceae archaeon A-arb3/5]
MELEAEAGDELIGAIETNIEEAGFADASVVDVSDDYMYAEPSAVGLMDQQESVSVTYEVAISEEADVDDTFEIDGFVQTADQETHDFGPETITVVDEDEPSDETPSISLTVDDEAEAGDNVTAELEAEAGDELIGAIETNIEEAGFADASVVDVSDDYMYAEPSAVGLMDQQESVSVTYEVAISEEADVDDTFEIDGFVQTADQETHDFGPETITVVDEEPPEEAIFTVGDLDPVDATVEQGAEIDVSATLTNDGDEAGETDVELRIDGDSVANQSVELEGDENETVTFQDVSTADLDVDEYTHSVWTADDEAEGTLTIEEPPEEATFSVSDLDPVDLTVDHGVETEIDVSAEVVNMGDLEGDTDVELRIDGDTIDTENVELEGGENETVTFQNVSTADLDVGEYTHAVWTADNSADGTLTVEEPPEEATFSVNDLQPETETVDQGDEFAVYALIANNGDLAGETNAEFQIDGDEVTTQTVELEGGESSLVPFTDISTSDLDEGDYTYSVSADGSSADGTLTVEEDDVPEPPEAELHLTADTPSDVEQGDDITAAVTVHNDGPDTFVGSYDVALELDGEVVASETVSNIGAGDSQTVDFSVDSSDYDGDVAWTLTADDVELSDNGSGTITVSAEGEQHESGVSQELFDAVDQDDTGELTRDEVRDMTQDYVQDGSVDDVTIDRDDVRDLIQYYVQQ